MRTPTQYKQPTILCVDDDPDDLQMLREAITMIDPDHNIAEAHDGSECIAILTQMVKEGNPPCIIVMDINMPKLDGKQTYISIKSNDELNKIPIVILSTSSSVLDKIFFEKKGTEFITKPIEFNHLVKVATRLLNYCKSH